MQCASKADITLSMQCSHWHFCSCSSTQCPTLRGRLGGKQTGISKSTVLRRDLKAMIRNLFILSKVPQAIIFHLAFEPRAGWSKVLASLNLGRSLNVLKHVSLYVHHPQPCSSFGHEYLSQPIDAQRK